MIIYRDEQFVTTEQACRMLGPDVTPALVQSWVRRGLLTPVGRVPGRSNLFRHEDVVEAEYRTRAEPRGRPRREAVHSCQTSKIRAQCQNSCQW